jgi:flagellar basal-body rod protein FlgB
MDIASEPLIDRMKQFLDVTVQRQQVISGNIANAETPGYQAKELNFADTFRTELGAAAPLRTARSRHISEPTLLRGPMAEAVQGAATPGSRNNVDLDKEMAHMAETYISFSLVAQLLQKRLHTLEYSIKEGRA